MMMKDSFHRNWGGGIDGTGKTGVAAIVLSGGYADYEDLGDTIVYTGVSGNEGEVKSKLKIKTGIIWVTLDYEKTWRKAYSLK